MTLNKASPSASALELSSALLSHKTHISLISRLAEQCVIRLFRASTPARQLPNKVHGIVASRSRRLLLLNLSNLV
jgi:hypothetical protein